MTPLARLIRQEIAERGPIGVDRFMALALGHPDHGYYRTRDPIGERGDFITAPEVSQMFGELIGLWCADTWHRQGRPAAVRLVELGPGRGTLMADAVRAIRGSLPEFREAASLHLIESSPVLRRKQEQALAADAPQWHDDIGAVPDGPAFIVANEFFDALPVRQYVWRRGRLVERLIGVEDDRLVFREGTSSSDPPSAIEPGRDGQIQERNVEAETLAGRLAKRISDQGGAALIVDYGYARTQPGETLQAVRRHERHDVLDAPGEADLTAHVDFAALKRAATAAGAEVHGPMFQGVFLRTLGIDARRDRLIRNAGPAQIQDLIAGYNRLTGAEGMGELFKAMAATPCGAPVPAGFDAGSGARPTP